jgi:RHS repeat-associated protein
MGITWKFTDKDSGLAYFYYRWFDHERGIWTSKDPIGVSVDTNLYEYCRGLPNLLIDPAGLMARKDLTWGGDEWSCIKSRMSEGFPDSIIARLSGLGAFGLGKLGPGLITLGNAGMQVGQDVALSGAFIKAGTCGAPAVGWAWTGYQIGNIAEAIYYCNSAPTTDDNNKKVQAGNDCRFKLCELQCQNKKYGPGQGMLYKACMESCYVEQPTSSW